MHSARSQKLQSIQALRGIAALLVVFLHIYATQASIISRVPASDPLPDFWQKGFAGVDIFFVISGFIMVYVTQDIGRNRRDILAFIKARIIRIYPLWWIYAGIMAAIFFTIFGVPHRPEIAEQSGGTGLYLLRSFLLFPQGENPVLPLGWTLIHEIYFYLIFAFFLLFPRKWLGLLLSVWALQVFGAAAMGIRVNATRDFFALVNSPLTIEFILGAVSAIALIHRQNVFPHFFALSGTLWFVLSLGIFPAQEALYGNWGRVIAFGIPAALIVYGIAGLESSQSLKTPRFLALLGDWSYSLYLGHLIVLLFVKNLWELIFGILNRIAAPEFLQNTFKLGSPGWGDNFAFTAASLISCIIVAALSFYYIERPLLAAAKKL